MTSGPAANSERTRAGSRTIDKAVVHPPAHKVAAALQALGIACVARRLALHQLIVVVRVYEVPAPAAELGFCMANGMRRFSLPKGTFPSRETGGSSADRQEPPVPAVWHVHSGS